MAIIRDPKDPKGLMAALGPSALGMGSSEENLIGDEPTNMNNNETFNDVEDNEKTSNRVLKNVEIKLDDTINLVKNISKKSGLQKDEVYKILSTLATALQNNVQKTITSALDVINPVIKKDLIEITRLLDTGSESDQQKAMTKLEELQKKFNLDLKKYNENLGINLDKLNKAVEKMAADKEEKMRLAENEQVKQLDLGRATTIDQDTASLKFLSRSEIKKREQEQKNLEKEIKTGNIELKKQLSEEGKGPGGAFSKTQQDTIIKREKEITDKQLKLTNLEKEVGQRKPGFIEKTGQVLKGEAGPELFRPIFQQFSGIFTTLADSIDFLTGGLFKKLGKSLGEKLTSFFSSPMKNFGESLTKGLQSFKTTIFKTLGDMFTLTKDGLKKGLSFVTDGLKSLIGSGKGTTAGGATGALTRGGGVVSKGLGSAGGSAGGGLLSRALPMIGLGGAGAAAGAGTVAAGAGATAAGGGLMAGLGGLATAAAPFLLPALGIAAAVGGIGYLGKKAYDKYQDNKNKTPEKLQEESDAFTNSEMGGNMEDVSKETKKILGKSDMAIKKIDSSISEPGELKAESESFVRSDEKRPENVNILTQNAPTVNNAGDTKTLVSPSYINIEPTYNLINLNRVT